MQIVLKMCQSSEFDPRTDRLSLPETHCPCKRKDEKKDEDDRYVENSTSDIRSFQKECCRKLTKLPNLTSIGTSRSTPNPMHP